MRRLRLAIMGLAAMAGAYGMPATAADTPRLQMAPQPAHAAEAVISGISVQASAKGPVLLIQANQRPDYDVNTLDGGHRVQVDFYQARFAPGVTPSGGNGDLAAVTTRNLPATHVARLELRLHAPMPIMVEPAPAGYRIAFAAMPAATAAAPAAGAAQVATEVADIDFHRLPNDGGRVNIQLTQALPNLDVQRQGDRLLIDLRGTRLPTRLERRLDVSDFGTPVKNVDSYARGRDTRLALQVNGPYDYATYQLGNQVVVEVKKKPAPTVAAGSRAEPGKPYTGARFSMDFQSIDIRNALQVIADFTGLNIVMADNVTGTLTMRLKNVPWDQALDVILQSKDLGMKREGNIIWVAPQKDIAAQEEARLKAEQAKQKMEPLVTELIQINYAKAEEIADLLKASSTSNITSMRSVTSPSGVQQTQTTSTSLQSLLGTGVPLGNTLLSDRGAVTVDKRTNSLLIKETPTNLANIKKLIAKLDRPVKQIMIEARIVLANTQAAHSLGIMWGGNYSSATPNGPIDLSNKGFGSDVIPGVPSINFPAVAAGGTAAAGSTPATFGFRLGSIAGNFLDLQLSALQAENLSRTISSPRVITADQQKATIEQGTDIPYQQATSSGATSVSFRKAVLSLEVVPHITPDGKVDMDVVAKNDTVGATVPGGVAINTQRVDTKVLVNNGETVVIGGIYVNTENKQDSGVPGLSKIPLLGYLFKGTQSSKSRQELLIFITPKVLAGTGAAPREAASSQ